MNVKKKNLFSLVLAYLLITLFVSSCVAFPNYEKEQEKTIANFVESSDENYIKKESGLYYAEVTSGVGTPPTTNDTVYINHSTFLLTNVLVETNFGLDPVDYVIGTGTLLPGVEEALTYMQPGGKSYALIPSYLGYGNYSIYFEPYTPLVYYIQLVKVGYFNDQK